MPQASKVASTFFVECKLGVRLREQLTPYEWVCAIQQNRKSKQTTTRWWACHTVFVKKVHLRQIQMSVSLVGTFVTGKLRSLSLSYHCTISSFCWDIFFPLLCCEVILIITTKQLTNNKYDSFWGHCC